MKSFKLLIPLILLFCAGIAAGQISYPKGSLSGPTTVAGLPLIGNSNLLYDVRDANPNCGTGGGTTRVVCHWTGAAYETVNTGGSGGGITNSAGNTIIPMSDGTNIVASYLTNASNAVFPTTDDNAALGNPTHNFSDLFLASGAVLNFANGNVAVTHSSGILTMGTGEFRITTPGTNAASVPTLGSTSELTNKTLNASVGKGTWTTSGTWTLPAFTLGGTVSGGGQQLNNIIIGTSNPLAGTFTTLTATTSLAIGSSPPTCTAGTGGVWCAKEGTATTTESGVDIMYADSTAHRHKVLNNGGTVDTVALFTDKLSVFASTTSAELRGVLSDENGTGAALFSGATSPDVTTSITTSSTSFTALAGATTLLTIGGTGASASMFAPSTLDASSSTTGAIRTSGGISAAKALNIGTTITGGGAFSIGTSNAATVGTIELGAASDTTIARSGAGVATIEGVTMTRTIAAGTSAMGTGAITSATCATAVTTTATGTLTTDTIAWGFNTDVTGFTGYAPVTSGMLTIFANPIADNVVFRVCNATTGSITPSALTINWKVIR